MTPPSKDWSTVVLAKLCEEYGGEFRKTKNVAIVNETQPIFDFVALLYGSGKEVTPANAALAQRLEERVRSLFVAEPISVPEMCNFRAIKNQERYLDVIKVEMSGLVDNPFDGSTGVFVRSSAGGRPGATWIWIGLRHADNRAWNVTRVFVLPTQDA